MNKRKRQEQKNSVPVRVSPRKPRQIKNQEEGASVQTAETSKQISKRKLEKECSSDSLLNDSAIDYDDDLDTLPDITLSSPSKAKKYAKDDIVWAPAKSMYWPAVVTSVSAQKVRYLLVNGSAKHVYRSDARKLISFDNSSKNSELKELGEKTDIAFPEAYELVVKYLCQKKQDKNLDAKRFLTSSDHNDQIGHAKHCLFRLIGCPGSNTLPEDRHHETVQNTNEEDAVLPDDGRGVNNEESSDFLGSHKEEDKLKIVGILKELESVPLHMTVSSTKLDSLRNEAEQLLDEIKSTGCLEYLMKIRSGTIRSSRHMKFSKDEFTRSGLGPFTLFQDLISQLFTVLDDYSGDEGDLAYKYNVMLPEAIIYAIMKKKGLSKLQAKNYFNLMSKKVEIRD